MDHNMYSQLNSHSDYTRPFPATLAPCSVKYKILLSTYKALNNTAPVYMHNLLSRHQPGRRLRSTDQCLLSVPRPRTKTYSSRSFKQMAPVLWNALPLGIKICGSVFAFKRAIKSYGQPWFFLYFCVHLTCFFVNLCKAPSRLEQIHVAE